MALLTVPCTIIKSAGYDLYGAEIEGKKKREKCAVIKLFENSARTTVRVDSGATRGAAEELVGTAQLLLSPRTSANMGDHVLMKDGWKFKIIQMRQRYTAAGKLDHYEVECKIG